MKAQGKSDSNIQATQATLALEGARSEKSIIQHLQRIESQERMKNREAIKSYSTNFEKLVDLVVSCGSEPLKYFMEKAGKNTTYTSHVAIVDFVEAIGIWVEEVMLERPHKAYYSIMAAECTDIATVEELSVYCRWVEDGLPVEHLLKIIHLPKGDVETIYSALIDCLKQKNLQVKKIVGMEQIHSQGTGMVFKLELRSWHLTPFLSTVTVTCCSWPVFKLLMKLQE